MLNACQLKLVRRMRGTKRPEDTAWLEWELRQLRIGRAQLHAAGVARWSTVALQRIWELWGHVARQSGPAREILQWRDLQWWKREQSLMGGQRHPGRFSPHVDPERRIQSVIDRRVQPPQPWMDVAQDRAHWQSLREFFVAENDVPWTGDRETALEDGDHLAPPGGQHGPAPGVPAVLDGPGE